MFYDTYDADASRVETTQNGALDGMITLHCSTTAIHRAKRNQIAVGTRQNFSKLQSVKKIRQIFIRHYIHFRVEWQNDDANN